MDSFEERLQKRLEDEGFAKAWEESKSDFEQLENDYKKNTSDYTKEEKKK